jgi:hypothetical protein
VQRSGFREANRFHRIPTPPCAPPGRSAKAELQQLLSSSASSAKRAVSELQGSLARAEASNAEAALPLEELRLRVEQVDAKKTGVLERVQRMVSARDASAAGIQALLQATLALKEEQRRMEAAKKQATPQLQCVRGARTVCDRASAAPHPPPLLHPLTHSTHTHTCATAPQAQAGAIL